MPANLKTLSRQYANGALSKEEYRRARMDLLGGVDDDDTTRPRNTQSATPTVVPKTRRDESDDA
ncbi:hypothetical protein BGP77_16705 [Saccharospirillum sp. MSK14-1]|uniref:SHOCT domain-containing protein n=1 Tax=Saccharospirillum sp. MSK14-1 TaxID=1897632 RepID=UPI000D3B1462|nr:SHOCT domain-containing protein [Saccharospirillum sp. MSK14-1]PTY38089.1 hypothetical protein BGP77_16705 [Saccharospirillum sp. MSK14-1]